MRKPSKMIERTELDKAEREAWAYRHIVNAIFAGEKPDATEIVKEEKGPGKTRLELWRAMSPEGGLLVSVWIVPGQTNSTSVYAFEEARPGDWAPYAYRDAYQRLRMARQARYTTEAARAS